MLLVVLLLLVAAAARCSSLVVVLDEIETPIRRSLLDLSLDADDDEAEADGRRHSRYDVWRPHALVLFCLSSPFATSTRLDSSRIEPRHRGRRRRTRVYEVSADARDKQKRARAIRSTQSRCLASSWWLMLRRQETR